MISHPIQLVLLPATDEAATCLRIDAKGTVLSRTRLTVRPRPINKSPRPDAPPAYTVLAVPGMDIRTIDVELPARSKAQALAAAQLLLEEQVAGARDSLHIAISDAPPDGGRQRLLAYTETATMQGWLDRAARLGIVADVVVPDFLLLPAPVEDGPVQVAAIEGRWLVRGPQQAFSSEPELARQVLGERAITLHEDATQVEALLAAGAANPPINLLQYRFAPASSARGGRPAYRRAAVFAALLLLSPLVITAAQAVRYSIAASALEHRAQSIARQWSAGDVDGDTDGAGNPASALQAPLARLRSNEDLPRMTAALFTAISGTTAARLERLQYRDTGALTGTLFHDTPDALDTIRDRVAADGLQLEATATQAVSGGYRSDVQLGPGS